MASMAKSGSKHDLTETEETLAKPIPEVYLENIRLRDMAGGSTDDLQAPVSQSDRIKLLLHDNKDIKASLKKEKKSKKRLFICVAGATLAQVIILLILAALYIGFTVSKDYNSQKSEAVAAPGPLSASLLQPLPVAPDKTRGSSLTVPLKYYFNEGLRQDDGLQECQGPQLKGSFPDMDYALLGYNILKGYPLAIGHDPGFTLPIFAADYSESLMTADCRYSVPKGIVLIPDVSCITSFSSDVVQTSYELSKSLSVSARVRGRGWGVSFSASTGYKEASSQMSTGESVFIISRASCNYYYMKLLKRHAPPFHPVFLDWIVELNNTEHNDVYIQFIENYGTHFPVEMKFGASFTYEHSMTSKCFKEESRKKVSVAVAASYSGLFSVSGGFNMDSSQKEAASNFQTKVTTRAITIGAPPPTDGNAMTWASTVKDSPVPVTYELESLEELFTETLMGKGYMEPYNIDYRKIKDKLGSLKYDYCKKLRDEGLVGSCEEMSPGLVMKSTRLYAHYDATKLPTRGQCIDECFKRAECVAMTFCENCDDPVCYLYKETKPFQAGQEEGWSAMFILTEIENRLSLSNTAIVSINKRKAEQEDITDVSTCERACMVDLYCVAFTFCTCPTKKEKCVFYAENNMSLKQENGTTTYFVSPRKRKTILDSQATTTTEATVPTETAGTTA